MKEVGFCNPLIRALQTPCFDKENYTLAWVLKEFDFATRLCTGCKSSFVDTWNSSPPMLWKEHGFAPPPLRTRLQTFVFDSQTINCCSNCCHDTAMDFKGYENGINFNHVDAGFQGFPLERHGRWVHSRNFCNGGAVFLSRTWIENDAPPCRKFIDSRCQNYFRGSAPIFHHFKAVRLRQALLGVVSFAKATLPRRFFPSFQGSAISASATMTRIFC